MMTSFNEQQAHRSGDNGMGDNLYAPRNYIEQGEFYVRHVDHMTREGLHDKSAIAGELAHRDIHIAELQAQIVTLKASKYAIDKYVSHLPDVWCDSSSGDYREASPDRFDCAEELRAALKKCKG